jgi:hypothetical protein
VTRKKKEPQVPAIHTELRTVRLDLPPGDHKRLKILAAEHDVPMAILARKIVQEYIARRTPKGGTK